jgi:aminodeoxyfutalosine synthase
MNGLWQQHPLRDIAARVEAGQRLTEAEALRLFQTRDVHLLSALASGVRERLNGPRASYIVNRYINYSNYCILSCQFCAFARKKRNGDGFELTVEEIVAKAREALGLGITELHIVGGLHPSLPYRYYLDMLRALKALDARLHLKCFTAIEVLHLATLAKKPMEKVLEELKEAGLDSLTGGGAEIFRPSVRSTCTMLYGHVETLEDRVDHLRQLRALQDETGGFCGFIPLPYQPENNAIPVSHAPSGFDTLRTMAVSRLYLDNIPHLTAYWVGLGLKLAQLALSYGADDLHGTIVEEHIFRMAGAKTPQLQTELAMVKAIREAGLVPVQRDTFYQPLKVWDGPAPRVMAPANGAAAILQNNLATA